MASGLTLARSLADTSPATEVFVVEVDGELRQVTGLGDGPGLGGAWPAWSPDGGRLAFYPSSIGTLAVPTLLVVDADGSDERVVWQLDVEEFSRAIWSADGRHLLFADATPPGDRRIWQADLASGEVARIGTGALPRWLDGRTRIAFTDGVAGLVAGDPAALTQTVFTMELADRVPRVFAHADDAAWSPTGDAVLIQRDGRLALAAADGSGEREIAVGEQPAWSPDGSRFAYLAGTDADGRALVAVMDRDGRQLWSGVVGHAPTWSPDGSRVAVEVSYPERVVRVLNAATGELLWETAGMHPAWRP